MNMDGELFRLLAKFKKKNGEQKTMDKSRRKN